MLQNLRTRGRVESGFTLIELLVVMLIIGLLAAIALPSFFNQRDKARDAEAKSAVRTAQTAMETYATDNNGVYDGADVDTLVGIEETLDSADLSVDAASGDTYKVTVTSDTDNTFSIERTSAGATILSCTTGGEGGCPEDELWD